MYDFSQINEYLAFLPKTKLGQIHMIRDVRYDLSSAMVKLLKNIPIKKRELI